MLRVVVRTPSTTRTIEVPPGGNVSDLYAAFNQEDMDLIVNGRILSRDVFAAHPLRSVGIEPTAQMTCFHAVPRGVQLRAARRAGAAPAAQAAQAAAAPMMDSFFVYCSDCGDVRASRMRTRCADCKSTAFVLHPAAMANSWEDLLTPRRFNGQCHGACARVTDAEFIFKCNDPRHAGAAEDATLPCTALPMVKSNAGAKLACPIHVDDDHVVRIDFPCNHSICLDCFREHARIRITEKLLVPIASADGGYSVSCPMCPAVVDCCNGRLFKSLDPPIYKKYQSFATELMVLAMPGGAVCPFEGCNEAFLDERADNRRTCPSCRRSHCRLCNNAWHTGRCDMEHRQIEDALREQGARPVHPEEFERQMRARAASERFVREQTKACPRCRAQILKHGGCNHMTCACGHQFCWVDLKAWGPECQSSHWFPN